MWLAMVRGGYRWSVMVQSKGQRWSAKVKGGAEVVSGGAEVIIGGQRWYRVKVSDGQRWGRGG